MTRVLRSLGTVGAVLALTGTGLLIVGPAASAATAPPPASNLRVTLRTDHQLFMQYAVPAAYYSPGGGAVVRLTRGATPAPSPTTGYPVVQVDGDHSAYTPDRPVQLTADAVYTFAVWIKAGGHYSARRSVTTRTLRDTTPPSDVGQVRARSSASMDSHDAAHARVVLTWDNPANGEPLKGTRIVRNTKPTTAGGTVFFANSPAATFVDDHPPVPLHLNTDAPTAYYWLLAQDQSGNYAKHYVRVSVVPASRTLTIHYNPDQIHQMFVDCCNRSASDPGVGGDAGTYSAPLLHGPTTVTVHVPPGYYRVCVTDPVDRDNTDYDCFSQASDGSIQHTHEFNDEPPYTNIDMVTRTSLELTFPDFGPGVRTGG